MKHQLKLIGREQWLCDHCPGDPIKNHPTPHCTDCGKHHPLHISCKGVSLVPPHIDYIAMFYQDNSRAKFSMIGIV